MKIIILSIALLLLLGLFFFLKKQQGTADHPNVHKIDKAQLIKILDTKLAIQLVDVRTALEYKQGHIKPAVNIDYLGKDFREKLNTYHKEKPLYLYCRSGSRSHKAAHLLAKEEFKEIYDLEGGILEWNKSK